MRAWLSLRSAFKKPYRTVGRRLQFITTEPLHRCSWPGTGSPPNGLKSRGGVSFETLILKVRYHHFCYIPLVICLRIVWGGGGCAKAWMTRDRDHWGLLGAYECHRYVPISRKERRRQTLTDAVCASLTRTAGGRGVGCSAFIASVREAEGRRGGRWSSGWPHACCPPLPGAFGDCTCFDLSVLPILGVNNWLSKKIFNH